MGYFDVFSKINFKNKKKYYFNIYKKKHFEKEEGKVANNKKKHL